jgi:hypothetical protein
MMTKYMAGISVPMSRMLISKNELLSITIPVRWMSTGYSASMRATNSRAAATASGTSSMLFCGIWNVILTPVTVPS